MEKLYIIGFGPGNETLLTESAKSAVKTARRILSTGRLSRADARIDALSLNEIFKELHTTVNGETAVLVSGDCGFFSAAKTIIRDFSGLYDIEVIPGISSIQLLSARLKTSYDDAALLSLHGRDVNIVPKVSYNKKIFALTGGSYGVHDICGALCRYGLGGVKLSVGERLSYPDEKITSGTAEQLRDTGFDGLSVVCIENPSAVNPHIPLSDSDFIRGDAPMTKEEVRWLSIQKLGICGCDIVYDIGAGTGSVAVEMARKAFGGFVYAIESKEPACALIKENAAKHGAFNIEIIHGKAPDALKDIPPPDKAFIGGSAGNMDGIVESLVAKNPGVKIVANAITVQTLGQIVASFEKHGLNGMDITCVNISKSKKINGYDMMAAQNPVYIITGTVGGVK